MDFLARYRTFLTMPLLVTLRPSQISEGHPQPHVNARAFQVIKGFSHGGVEPSQGKHRTLSGRRSALLNKRRDLLPKYGLLRVNTVLARPIQGPLRSTARRAGASRSPLRFFENNEKTAALRDAVFCTRFHTSFPHLS